MYKGPGPASKMEHSDQAGEEGMGGNGWTAGTFDTTVGFSEPGTVTLRTLGSDAMLISKADVTVTVTE